MLRVAFTSVGAPIEIATAASLSNKSRTDAKPASSFGRCTPTVNTAFDRKSPVARNISVRGLPITEITDALSPPAIKSVGIPSPDRTRSANPAAAAESAIPLDARAASPSPADTECTSTIDASFRSFNTRNHVPTISSAISGRSARVQNDAIGRSRSKRFCSPCWIPSTFTRFFKSSAYSDGTPAVITP